MRVWLNIWYWAMALGLFLFASITVTVAFGAFRDVHAMLQKLLRQHAREQTPQPPET